MTEEEAREKGYTKRAFTFFNLNGSENSCNQMRSLLYAKQLYPTGDAVIVQNVAGELGLLFKDKSIQIIN